METHNARKKMKKRKKERKLFYLNYFQWQVAIYLMYDAQDWNLMENWILLNMYFLEDFLLIFTRC
jgi:hypothetical protein